MRFGKETEGDNAIRDLVTLAHSQQKMIDFLETRLHEHLHEEHGALTTEEEK
jgi:hypothetical protein